MYANKRLFGLGNETFAIVEFAPFQKVPQERKKQDARMGTIQQGPPHLL